jgi:hypothetical protein
MLETIDPVQSETDDSYCERRLAEWYTTYREDGHDAQGMPAASLSGWSSHLRQQEEADLKQALGA